ncbi:polysaccharide biosynthesis/export family protein [Mucilaginibacter calamicampi]|uniref:Polysaccharide biosynthesis/export family protein n=1 Tax=Mucilaginibacter calamicampi TaxID=1302352 RepID=A0ABW2YZE7_9SPHI
MSNPNCFQKKYMRFKIFLLTIGVALLIGSCTPYKNVPYYQDLKQDSIVTEQIINYSPIVLQAGDMIALNVVSLSREADAVFNYNLVRPNSTGANAATTGEITSTAQNAVVGYLVDKDGNISLPTLGPLKIGGLTLSQAKSALENKLSAALLSPNVEVRLMNFKVSVLGDVQNPGLFNIATEKINVNEVLALAGDLNTTGVRNSIFLIRETEGKREYVPIDLTSKKIFSSQYYYLKNNDVIYVKPNRDRVLATDSYAQRLSLLFSALTIVAVFLSR